MPDNLLKDAFQYALEKLENSSNSLQGFPHTTKDGKWLQSDHGRWTAGFWVGALWLAHLFSGDKKWAERAASWSRRLEFRKKDVTTHDMGFLFQPSFVRGWKITGDPYYRDVALTACASHAGRYNPAGKFIPAWDTSEDPSYDGLTIVDTVMNLPILIWGAETAHRPEWRTVALSVAGTIIEHNLRADGSTFHVVEFEPRTGEPRKYGTHQGYSDDSCWSRGQAWALYGFTQMHGLTGSEQYLKAARSLADYYIAHLPADFIPYWDFAAPGIPDEPRDSAAAAIAASGLLDLAVWADEADRSGEVYRNAAMKTLESLVARCLSRGRMQEEGILLHGVVDYPRRSAVDVSIIYGDHYFLEALLKVTKPEARPSI